VPQKLANDLASAALIRFQRVLHRTLCAGVRLSGFHEVVSRIDALRAALGAFDRLSRPRGGDSASVELERDPVAALRAHDVFRLHSILLELEYAPILSQRGINRAGRSEAERLRVPTSPVLTSD